jgi:hypothetical protein
MFVLAQPLASYLVLGFVARTGARPHRTRTFSGSMHPIHVLHMLLVPY